jgi:Lhr-like helicase
VPGSAPIWNGSEWIPASAKLAADWKAARDVSEHAKTATAAAAAAAATVTATAAATATATRRPASGTVAAPDDAAVIHEDVEAQGDDVPSSKR